MDLLADFLQFRAQVFGRSLDVVSVGLVIVDNGLEVFDCGLDLTAQIVVDLFVVLLEQGFSALDRGFGGVASLDALAFLLVFFGVFLRFFLQTVDLASERPAPPSMVISSLSPEPLSSAETLTIPFSSIENVTSICGVPAGAGGIPVRWNSPSISFSAAISRSPWKTRTCTVVWLSAAW